MEALKFTAALLAALTLFALAGCSDEASAPGEIPAAAVYRVEPRDLRVTVTETGSLKTRNQELVRPRIPGQAKIMSLIEEGSIVKEGDVLCQLDQTDIEKEIASLDTRLIQLDGELTAAKAEYAIQLSENEADIANAELKQHFAEVELERYQKGEFVQERKKREVRVEEARSSLDRASRKYEQMPALLEEGFVTQAQVEEERINEVKAKSEVELAELDLSTYMTYTSPKDLEQKQADVRNARLEVDRAKQRAAAREAQRKSAVDRLKSEQDSASLSMAQRKEVLENMTIRAPGPGIVIYGDARNPWDEREIKVGEMVYSGQPFLTLPDLTEMQVVVGIHEADIARVSTGQAANITVDTVRGRAIDGEVVKVGRVAAQNRRRWSDQSKRFSVDIGIEGDIKELGLKPGLTAKVEILVDELKGVLAVPTQCVFAESGHFYLFRRTPAGPERVAVTIEDGNASHVVVTSGISAGDEVLLYNPERSEGSAPAVQPGPPGESGGDSGKP